MSGHTPQTDALLIKLGHAGNDGQFAKFARDLERQRDDCLALLQEWLDTSLDVQDEEFEPWIESFTERIKAAIAKAAP